MACIIMMTRVPSSVFSCLFRFDAITIGSHSRAMRTQISDPDCPFWGSFLVPCSKARENFFFHLLRPSTHQQLNYSSASVSLTDYNMSQPGRSPLYVWPFQPSRASCRTKLTASNMSAPLYSYSTSPWKCHWPSKASGHPRPFLSSS
jgi:hypothetical protein